MNLVCCPCATFTVMTAKFASSCCQLWAFMNQSLQSPFSHDYTLCLIFISQFSWVLLVWQLKPVERSAFGRQSLRGNRAARHSITDSCRKESTPGSKPSVAGLSFVKLQLKDATHSTVDRERNCLQATNDITKCQELRCSKSGLNRRMYRKKTEDVSLCQHKFKNR